MKNKYRLLKVLVTVVVLGFLLNFSMRRFSEKPMDHVRVHLIQGKIPVYFVDETDIKEIILQTNPSQKLGDANIPEMEKRIRTSLYIDSANVYLNLAGDIHVDIVQKVPVFRVNDGERSYYVSDKSKVFPLSKQYSPKCMLVSGNIPKEDFRGLVHLVQMINADSFLKDYFIGIKKEHNDYYLLTYDGNYEVELGDLEKTDIKLKGYKAFMDKYLVYQNPEKYSKISVKFDNQIVTTLKGKFKDSLAVSSPEPLPSAAASPVLLPKPEKKTTSVKNVASQKKPVKTAPKIAQTKIPSKKVTSAPAKKSKEKSKKNK